jgi:hypothetical protein
VIFISLGLFQAHIVFPHRLDNNDLFCFFFLSLATATLTDYCHFLFFAALPWRRADLLGTHLLLL